MCVSSGNTDIKTMVAETEKQSAATQPNKKIHTPPPHKKRKKEKEKESPSSLNKMQCKPK